MTEPFGSNRCYWVVSPNVRNNEATVGDWRRASVLGRAAFMGWTPDDPDHKQMGPKFAGIVKNGIRPGDVILIARRHLSQPEVVGFGVVRGKSVKRVSGVDTPDSFGSARLLQPFVPWTGMPPRHIPIREVIKHTTALAELHPDSNNAHRRVCEWLDAELSGKLTARSPRRKAAVRALGTVPSEIRIVDSPKNHQLDYKVRTQSRVLKAKKDEARLLEAYRSWLARQGREFSAFGLRRLQCDAYEVDRKNLIEAKASTRREHVRMAVGQLLDYAYQGRSELGAVHKAVLLPEKPSPEIEEWLDSLNIKIVWREKNVFLDNANGQFT